MKMLIIGMGPGIGFSLAKRFGAEGAEILMMARNAEKLAGFEKALQAVGITSKSYAVDIGNVQAYTAALQQLAAEHPDLDILHYNASAYNPTAPSLLAYSTFLHEITINTGGALLAAQAFLPAMKLRGKGTVFFTGGGSAHKAPPELVSLSIGKAGIRNLAYCLAQEYAPIGIQVSTVTVNGMVAPGTKLDPDTIAGMFWELYQLPKAQWIWEKTI
ncbi:MAG: SDR family NAD(P)-dependent oxidoreductase [Lewinellaceae bacterium]|nr:SDR family NAD(P)-dependent oxidoreductase [Lewinellaceae bacterium]